MFSFKEAVFSGLAEGGGLFMPQTIPQLPSDFFEHIEKLTFAEIAYEVAHAFLKDEIPAQKLKSIIEKSLNFPLPLVSIDRNLYSLELFHGPTLSFKDFGARFLAHILSYFLEKTKKQLVVLVATSGDTGSAVAASFYQIPNIDVVLLYPKGKVSFLQEQQLTTWSKNIGVIEVSGSFDDCQRLVKEAFADPDLANIRHFTSANSINIARLLPQLFYYFDAYSKVTCRDLPVVFSVPSGNFGNLTAGLLAKRMGLPVKKFIAATNKNDVFERYLKTGVYEPKSSKQTIANAMDVENPNNMPRILDLYNGDVKKLKNDVWAVSFSDTEIKQAIKDVYKKYGYILDPHGAVSYLGLMEYKKQTSEPGCSVFLETAHPAKFKDTIEEILGIDIPMPKRLIAFSKKEKHVVQLSNDYSDFKHFLL